jgi:hypothetical protein
VIPATPNILSTTKMIDVARVRMLAGHKPLQEGSSELPFRHSFALPPTSSTSGTPTSVYGSRTFVWHAMPEELMMTLFVIQYLPMYLPKMCEHGSNTSQRIVSIHGPTSSAFSWETFRAHTYALELSGTSKTIGRSLGRLYMSTFTTSPSSAMSSLTSSTLM